MRRLNELTNSLTGQICTRLVVAVALLCCAVSPLAAQKKADPNAKEKALITEVKRSPDKYVYAEATCTTQEEAKSLAEEMFYENVNEYVAEIKKLKTSNDVVINDAKQLSQIVTMPRGNNMYRAFYYVKKSDIVAMNNPVLLPGHQPVAEVEEKPQQVKEGKSAAKSETTANVPAAEVKPVYPEAAIELSKQKNVSGLNAALKRMKQSGAVTAYARYKEIAVKSEWYLVLYDATGAIKAVLSDGDERTNVATGQADSVKNYPKHAALGVQFKK